MKRLTFILLLSSMAFGQGVILPPQQVLKVVNGITSPAPFATVTVCAANVSGIPCAPALVNALFKDAALTQALPNPFTADVGGNYQFAIAPGGYTVTTTAVGFAGYSYQITAPLAAGANNAFTGNLTFSGSNTFTAGNVFSGTTTLNGGGSLSGGFGITAKNLNNIQFADQFAGGDCGAKINAADAALGLNSGLIYVNAVSCGFTWTTAVSISAGHTLRFISTSGAAFQVFTSAGISLDGSQAAIDGQVGALNNVTIAATNGVNIPYVVRMNNSLQSLSNLTVNGNVANNPTGGAAILVTNAAPRAFIWRVNATGAPSFGILFNSNVAGSGAFDGHVYESYVLSNQGGGIMERNTTDLFVSDTPIDVNGSIGTVNTQNAATGGCAANCVTWVSGPQWTTDSSLVGTKILIGTTFYFISSIQSATVLTISAAPGTQTGVNYGIGSNIELSDSPGLRLQNSDMGGGGSCGLWMYGTSAGKQSTREIIGPGNQFGNTNNHDICVAGYDTVGAAYAAGQYSIIQGNDFIGLSATATTNKWDHIYCIDCSNIQIVGNQMFSLNSPQNKAAIEYVENLVAEGTKARPAFIEGNYFSDGTALNWTLSGTYGTAKIINSTANGMSGQVLWNNGFSGNQLSATAFCDEGFPTDAAPCKFLTVAGAGGTLQIANNANTAILKLTDAGQLSTSISGGGFFNTPQVIASGTAAMTTAAIAAGACGTTVTVAAANVATTDTITWAFNAAPGGQNAGLVAWPTSGNVNFAYCSNTAETPAAATINWRVVR